MSYYDQKKRELQELLSLIKSEKADFAHRVRLEKDAIASMAKLESEAIDKSTREMNKMKTSADSHIREAEAALDNLVREKTKGFPWLVRAYNDYWRLQDEKAAKYLEEKSHPAHRSAEYLRQIAKERREAEKAARIANYLLEYCKFLAPWLEEYIGIEAEELDQIIKDIHSSWEVMSYTSCKNEYGVRYLREKIKEVERP
jgi:hypothetical protein